MERENMKQHQKAFCLPSVEYAEPTRVLELLMFAHMNLSGVADARLARQGWGRAHHRALHFISKYPGMSVNELLAILRITNQAIARVMKQLLQADCIRQEQDQQDKRQRRLFITPKGKRLLKNVFVPQFKWISTSLEKCDRAEIDGFFKVMEGFLYDEDTKHLSNDRFIRSNGI